MLDLDLLRSFVSVVDAGGFTRASQRVHRTQAAVSQQIKRLEHALGCPLFARDGGRGRRVTLTDAGERLLAYARRILALAEEAHQVVGQPGESVIRLGIPEDFAARGSPRCWPDRCARVRSYGSTCVAISVSTCATSLIAVTSTSFCSSVMPVKAAELPLGANACAGWSAPSALSTFGGTACRLSHSRRAASTATGLSTRSRPPAALGTSPIQVRISRGFRPRCQPGSVSASFRILQFCRSITCSAQGRISQG
jgi:Bacterial regulatory helix-turn-helix protein, lysR family